MRWYLVSLFVMGLGSLFGCAEDLEVPPAVGMPCAVDADCQVAGLACGQILACLAGRCEAEGDEPALVEPCEARGRPADASMSFDADVDAGS